MPSYCPDHIGGMKGVHVDLCERKSYVRDTLSSKEVSLRFSRAGVVELHCICLSQ